MRVRILSAEKIEQAIQGLIHARNVANANAQRWYFTAEKIFEAVRLTRQLTEVEVGNDYTQKVRQALLDSGNQARDRAEYWRFICETAKNRIILMQEVFSDEPICERMGSGCQAQESGVHVCKLSGGHAGNCVCYYCGMSFNS